MDYDALTSAIAFRKAEAQQIQTAIDLVCENAANRHAATHPSGANRSAWSPPAWNRYVAAAVKMERLYGARLRRLYQDIQTLERLASLPHTARAS
ncbi:hypothetical protein RZS28_18520 (plasmid) [Methylocapsa polymorpha]|uniref:Uncharacterized protein n=1 Tax=Methylocapsa polymorpha TaxID=3080828 RepID=A0ABZ0HWW0_9HYPH|nr:hypothetical protein [Methylocapsa sp. RX1]WOJ91723.1 hypothetical protein RZS28_18520 [Methylocapsa sp. RX1]